MMISLKSGLRAALLAAGVAAALAGGVAQAQTQEIPLITGEHWAKST